MCAVFLVSLSGGFAVYVDPALRDALARIVWTSYGLILPRARKVATPCHGTAMAFVKPWKTLVFQSTLSSKKRFLPNNLSSASK